MDKQEIKKTILRWVTALLMVFAIFSLVAEYEYQEGNFYSENY